MDLTTNITQGSPDKGRTHESAISATAAYGYIPGLDGLRAIAVLIVLVAHFGLSHLVPGGFGVTVFFFISGFLITRLLIAESEKKGGIGLKDFYVRRFIRLIPALIGMTFVTTAIHMALSIGAPTLTEFAAANLYFTNYYQIAELSAGNAPHMSWTPLWSLAVEEHFYLMFPLLLVFLRRDWVKVFFVLLAVIAVVPLWRLGISVVRPDVAELYTYMATDARIDSIAWGCLFSVGLHLLGKPDRLKFLIGWGPVLVAGAVLLSTFVLRDPMFRQVIRYSLQGLAIGVLILNLYFGRAFQWAFPILELAPLRWIGRVSYGLYLWHFPVLDLVRRMELSGPVTIVLALALSFAVTALSFYFWEQKFVRLRKRFGAHIVKAPT
jgi:peptidoglycan/LPS O-acetylase OafA/YrhL